jgi:hypothetical protein
VSTNKPPNVGSTGLGSRRSVRFFGGVPSREIAIRPEVRGGLSRGTVEFDGIFLAEIVGVYDVYRGGSAPSILAALGQARQILPVLDRIVLGRAIARMRPHTMLDVADAVHVERGSLYSSAEFLDFVEAVPFKNNGTGAWLCYRPNDKSKTLRNPKTDSPA